MTASISTANMANYAILIYVAVILSSQCINALESKDVAILEKYRVVPDVVPSPPVTSADIKYGNLKLKMGDELTPTQVRETPSVSWPIEDGAHYALFMNDPDVPRYLAKEFQHWVVFNIPGNDISKGDTAFQYIGAGPPKKTGLHRYIFLIYKQDGLIEKEKFSDINDLNASNRKNFLLTDLLQRFNFENPIAGNFFRAQFEENVPK